MEGVRFDKVNKYNFNPKQMFVLTIKHCMYNKQTILVKTSEVTWVVSILLN